MKGKGIQFLCNMSDVLVYAFVKTVLLSINQVIASEVWFGKSVVHYFKRS